MLYSNSCHTNKPCIVLPSLPLLAMATCPVLQATPFTRTLHSGRSVSVLLTGPSGIHDCCRLEQTQTTSTAPSAPKAFLHPDQPDHPTTFQTIFASDDTNLVIFMLCSHSCHTNTPSLPPLAMATSPVLPARAITRAVHSGHSFSDL